MDEPGTGTPFSIDVRTQGDQCDLRVSGDVDLRVSEQLSAAGVRSVNESPARSVVIDLGAVTFLDSTGLGALIAIRNAAVAQAKELSLRHTPAGIRKVITMTGLDVVLPSVDVATAHGAPSDPET
jgi:anti-anti-sigma factor